MSGFNNSNSDNYTSDNSRFNFSTFDTSDPNTYDPDKPNVYVTDSSNYNANENKNKSKGARFGFVFMGLTVVGVFVMVILAWIGGQYDTPGSAGPIVGYITGVCLFMGIGLVMKYGDIEKIFGIYFQF